MFKRDLIWDLPGKESACQCRRHEFDPWSGKIPHAKGQLSLHTIATEPVLYSLGAATTESMHSNESLSWATREAPARRSSFSTTREKPTPQQRPSTAK